MTEQKQLPPQKQKRSALRRQRLAALVGLGVVVLLTVVFIIVWTLTSRTVFEDFDGAKYYIRSKKGEYVLLDADKNLVKVNEDGNYVTAANTILMVDAEEGTYQIVAVVPVEGTETLEFDYYSGQFDVLMYPKIERDSIRSIRIVNQSDSFGFIRKSDGTFSLDGYPGIPYDSVMFATLVNLTGYTVTLDRLDLSDPNIAYGFAQNGYAEYGLPEDPDDATRYFVITKTDGTSHKVLIGNEIPSGAGYYARYVGRDAVYIMKEFTESENNSTLAKTLLGKLEDYVTPLAVVPMSSSSYFDVTNFTLYRVPADFVETGNLEQVIKFSYEPIENRKGTFYSSFPYVAQGMLEGYFIHSYHADDCLQNLQLLKPLRTVQINRPETPLDEGTFALTYGVAYALDFTYNDARDGNQNVTSSYKQNVWISPLSADDTYFVFSTIYDMVVEVSRSDLEFLEWTTFEWISDDIFTANIAYCKKISFETDNPSSEGLAGVTSAVFTIDNSASPSDTTSNGNVNTSAMRVYADYTASETDYSGVDVNMDLFKRFYQALLYSSLEGNAALTEEQMDAYRASGDAGADLIIRVVYDIGGSEVEYVFRFYHYSDRQSFMTLNGNGSFYMLRNRTVKILNDLGRVLYGDPSVVIDPQAKT